jgi:ABC-type Mn2+/Zn2+ transport system ATPase subunit/histidinol phosphatase-like PHP family hydrolase
MEIISNGAHFLKADLHIHSYGAGGSYDVNDVQMTPPGIVDTAIAKGLSVISITDHNEVMNSCTAVQYAEDKNILVIPGVELSTTQGHLLVYFDTVQHLRNFFARVTIADNRKSCQTGIVECLNIAEQFSGFGVLAHIDIDGGFEKAIGSFNLQMEEILKHRNLLGLEISNKSNISWYTDADTSDQAAERKKLVKLRTATLDKEQTDSLPKLMSSDAHTIDKLGKNIDNEAKLTRLKMDELTFDSFRIALHSGSSRVRIESELPDIVPRFDTLTLEGGLLDKQEVRFSNNLTCIIGGRGTGKSTMLECVRVGSGNQSDEAVIDSEVWPDVLRLSYIDEEGRKHTFRREKNQETSNQDLDGISICPIEWYGQGETAKTIEKSEENSVHLINFLNTFVDLTAISIEDEKLREDLRLNQSELMQLRLDIKQRQDVEKIKKNFDAQLRQLQQDKVKDLVTFNLSLAKEREIRKSVIQELNDLIKKYGSLLSDKTVFERFRTLDVTDIKIGSDYIKNVKDIVEQFAQIVATKHTELIGELNTKIEDLKVAINNWKAKDTEYQQKIDAKRAELENKGIPFDLGKINKIISDSMLYDKKLKEIEEKEKQLKEKLKARRELVKKRIELSSKRFLLHQSFASKINANLKNNVDDFFVTLRYSEGMYSPTFRDAIVNISQWRKVKVDAMVKAVSPLQLAGYVAKKDLSFMDDIKDASGVNIFNSDDKKAFLERCLDSFRYEEFESEMCDDLPAITVAKKVLDDAGNEIYNKRSLYQLSMGQQQSILLAILLQSDSKRPLLIDQPEDNLDSEFIYKSIVRNLRRIKEHRQVIIVTHNANIAVLGDAELIIPLKSTSTRTMIMDRGSIDNNSTKTLCCEILEGGKRAFKKRQTIYNI